MASEPTAANDRDPRGVVDGGNPTGRLTGGEVGRIVNAAKALIKAHSTRSPTSKHSTLNEDAALWELNFQLGEYRARKGMLRG